MSGNLHLALKHAIASPKHANVAGSLAKRFSNRLASVLISSPCQKTASAIYPITSLAVFTENKS
jgi:hypothetical protein